MSQKPVIQRQGFRPMSRLCNGQSISSVSPPDPLANTSTRTSAGNSEIDGQDRALLRSKHSLPSPLDQIDPQRWKHFPRFSTTSDFATYPFSDIDVSEEELHLSADEQSIIGTSSSVKNHRKKGSILSANAPEKKIRNAAAEVCRAVSDSSDKIKDITTKLRRAPSTLLNRSRSRVLGSHSPVAFHARSRGSSHPCVEDTTNCKEDTEIPKLLGPQLQRADMSQSREVSTAEQSADDRSGISSHVATPVDTVFQIGDTIDDDCKQNSKNPEQADRNVLADTGEKDSPRKDSTFSLPKTARESEPTRNSLIDQLDLYPKESLAWLANNPSRNESPMPLLNTTNGRFQEPSSSTSKGVSLPDQILEKISFTRPGVQTTTDKQTWLTLGHSRSYATDVNEPGVDPESVQVRRSSDIHIASRASHRTGSFNLLTEYSHPTHGEQIDGQTPPTRMPRLRRTVSRIFRGKTFGVRNENKKS